MKLSRLIGIVCFGVLVLALRFVQAQNHKRDDDKDVVEKFVKSFSEPIRISESKPVTVNEAQFILVAQTNWKPGKPGNASEPMVALMVAPIEIQLRITNLGKGDVVFPTFQTFGIRVLNADGKEVKPRSIRKGHISTRPILVPGGASYSICPRGELRWDEKTKASELSFYDGTGSQLVIGPLQPGRYKMVLWYSVPPNEQEKLKVGRDPTWLGNAVTGEMLVEVLDGTTRGFPPANEQYVGAFAGPIIIRESKPVTVNDARFVVVAQADWKPGEGKAVAIDLQLRITNLSKSELLFPAFDTFGVSILDAGGKKIMPRGGRDLTAMPRPILIPAGASYSLAAEGGPPSSAHRRAELYWDLKTKASELVYFDGTGTGDIFGPLKQGRYELFFWYSVSRNGPFRTERDPATWLGNAVTEHAFIDVLAP